jgi:hypothetical protein
MATPVKQPPINEVPKEAVLMAVAQLDMLITAFGIAPERVQKAAKEFRDSLEAWANG